MKVPNFIKNHKSKIDSFLSEYISQNSINFKNHGNSSTLFPYLVDFCRNGKSIRGSLFLEFVQLTAGGRVELDKYLPIAGAMELIHSALLIQDDWMDGDNFRRGQIALHSLLEREISTGNHSSAIKYSGQATNCAADVIFFLAFKILNQFHGDNLSHLSAFIMEEYVSVGFAQWQEIYTSYHHDYTFDTIENIYRYKTARYTFTMPIVSAFLICGVKRSEVMLIEEITEKIGMIFQITDDRLNIFGDTSSTKKSLGSDIAENKKTYYHFFFHQLCEKKQAGELKRVKKLFGKKSLSDTDLSELKDAFTQYGIEKQVSDVIAMYQKQCTELLDRVGSKEYRTQLQNILEYIVNRES